LALAVESPKMFLVVLDSPSTLPIWVPHTHVYLNYKEYGLDQAVGAIKARHLKVLVTLARRTSQRGRKEHGSPPDLLFED
jgi:hypothetical protein